MKKCRIFMLHPGCNSGKINVLEALHAEYVAYVQICIRIMLEAHKLNLHFSKRQGFFPRAEKLTSQIEKNARGHAIQLVSSWAKSIYTLKLRLIFDWLLIKGT